MTPKALKHAVEQIEMDEAMQARVLRRSLDAMEEHDTMKQKKNYKRIAIVAVAAVMALSVTAFAAVRNQVKVIWTDESDVITSLSEAQEALAGTGSKLTLPEQLPGGYTFESADISHQMMAEEQELPENKQLIQRTDSEDGIVYSFAGETAEDGVACTYKKNGDAVRLDASKSPDSIDSEGCNVVEKNGITFFCSSGETVAVSSVAVEDGDLPEDFDPADFDPEALDGSAMDVDTQDGTYNSICWAMDGITYSLSQLNGDLSHDQLIDMALVLCGK